MEVVQVDILICYQTRTIYAESLHWILLDFEMDNQVGSVKNDLLAPTCLDALLAHSLALG